MLPLLILPQLRRLKLQGHCFFPSAGRHWLASTIGFFEDPEGLMLKGALSTLVEVELCDVLSNWSFGLGDS